MLLSTRNRGLTRALNIQRNTPIATWPTEWAQIEDREERQVAETYLREMIGRHSRALAARKEIERRSTQRAGER
jgi:hypothetical protein